MKSGYKTTEFWITVGVMLAGVLKGIPMPPWAYVAATAAYAVARGLAKERVSDAEDEKRGNGGCD